MNLLIFRPMLSHLLGWAAVKKYLIPPEPLCRPLLKPYNMRFHGRTLGNVTEQGYQWQKCKQLFWNLLLYIWTDMVLEACLNKTASIVIL